MYETKDSGTRQEYESGMHRDLEDNKPRFDLMIPEGVPFEEQMLTRFARLMQRGAVKYTARNWELADSAEEHARAKSSALRHLMQWFMGETDEDHAAGVMFNLTAAETIAYKRKREAQAVRRNLLAISPGEAMAMIEHAIEGAPNICGAYIFTSDNGYDPVRCNLLPGHDGEHRSEETHG